MICEVIVMDEQRHLTPEEQPTAQDVQQEDTGYIPRPMWQVWLARIGLLLFLFVVAMYYINMFRGG